MKNTHFYYLIIVLLSLTVSCKKDSPKIAAMQAKVDGVLVICDSTVYLVKGLDGTLYGINGFKKGNVGFILRFPLTTGTFQFLTNNNSGRQNEAGFQYDFNNQYAATNGSVTITEATREKYKGIFSFSAQNLVGDARTITDGSFEIDP